MVDYEYEQEDDYGPRVLWGRVAFFVVGLTLAFLLGTCVGRGGGDSAQLTAEQRRVQELSTEVNVLEQRLAASQDGGGGADGGGGGGGGGGGDAEDEATDAEDEGQDPIEEGETYVVESGDTLISIAERFYGDGSLYPRIEDANNLDQPLQVGQELVIPPQE